MNENARFVDEVRLNCRRLESPAAAELYLTAEPPAGLSVAEQAAAVYSAIEREASQAGARLFGERVFATKDAMAAIDRERRKVFDGLDDGVAPTPIIVTSGAIGPFVGVQVHAIASQHAPKVVRCWGQADATAARVVEADGHRWLFVNGLCHDPQQRPAEQARRMFECAGCLMQQAGADMRSVARTWLWLKDVCDWYSDLNATRNQFFRAEGLIDPVRRTQRLPASTGIGMGTLGGSACTLDLIALPGREDEIELLEAGGDQRSAYEYGSAFSRASAAPMPGGRTVFISGTAAIDTAGISEHIGENEKQVAGTIQHVRHLLAQLDCGDEHVLTALAYCKSPEVEKVFREQWADLPWPRLTMVCDVCRPELLFEIEVTASPQLNPQA